MKKKKYTSASIRVEALSPSTILSGSVDWGGSAPTRPGGTGGIGGGDPKDELGTNRLLPGDAWDNWK